MDTLESLPLKDGVMAIADESYFDWAVLPETPSSLSATLSGPSVRLKWDLHGGDPKGTVIENRVGKVPGNESQWKQIAKLENNATEYTDLDVAEGQGAAPIDGGPGVQLPVPLTVPPITFAVMRPL